MLIKMNQTRMASDDGHRVIQFVVNEIYDIAESCGRFMCAKGWATKPTLTEAENAVKNKTLIVN